MDGEEARILIGKTVVAHGCLAGDVLKVKVVLSSIFSDSLTRGRVSVALVSSRTDQQLGKRLRVREETSFVEFNTSSCDVRSDTRVHFLLLEGNDPVAVSQEFFLGRAPTAEEMEMAQHEMDLEQSAEEGMMLKKKSTPTTPTPVAVSPRGQRSQPPSHVPLSPDVKKTTPAPSSPPPSSLGGKKKSVRFFEGSMDEGLALSRPPVSVSSSLGSSSSRIASSQGVRHQGRPILRQKKSAEALCWRVGQRVEAMCRLDNTMHPAVVKGVSDLHCEVWFEELAWDQAETSFAELKAIISPKNEVRKLVGGNGGGANNSSLQEMSLDDELNALMEVREEEKIMFRDLDDEDTEEEDEQNVMSALARRLTNATKTTKTKTTTQTQEKKTTSSSSGGMRRSPMMKHSNTTTNQPSPSRPPHSPTSRSNKK